MWRNSRGAFVGADCPLPRRVSAGNSTYPTWKNERKGKKEKRKGEREREKREREKKEKGTKRGGKDKKKGKEKK